MKKRFENFRLLPVLAALLLLVFPPGGHASPDLESLAELPPGEQYRQLSLLMLVSGGVDPALAALLEATAEGRPPTAGQELALDDYVTPLIRIVDQEALLAHASGIFRYARQNREAIQARLTEIARNNPILVSMVDVNDLAADAIIIRNAIADSVEYAASVDSPDKDALVRAFRVQTVYLRNMMEYNQFQEELAEITDQAILDLGGRLDAYQRMFEDDVDPDLVKRRVESAEIMNRQTSDRFEDQAMLRNTELLMMLILMESQVH
jgi:hypothetical protein